MANIHIFLQGKGGVGKSFSASMLAQFFLDSGKNVVCIDTDPVNATFSAYRRFQATHIDLMKNRRIDPLRFDEIIEKISEVEEDANVVIDNGASSFIAFSSFILENDVASLLSEMGNNLYVHTIITGGDSQDDTVHGFASLVSQFQTPLIVWINPYFGTVERGGKGFEDFKPYRDNRDRVAGIIHLPDFPVETFGINLQDMLKSRLTFAEALENSNSPIMTRQRLKIAQRQIYAQLEACPEL